MLHETRDWLATLPNSVDFVDPEVGMMAQAGVKSRIRFGYLHITSDNVAEKYEEDLSNERMQSVLSRRSKLYDVVQDVLGNYLPTARSREKRGCLGILSPPVPMVIRRDPKSLLIFYLGFCSFALSMPKLVLYFATSS